MTMKSCRHCHSELDSSAIVCPHCRRRQRPILPVAAVLLATGVSFLAGFLAGGWFFIPRHVSTRPTGVETQPRQTWRITSADFEQTSDGAELEQVTTALGPPTVTWWEEKTALIAIWANPDSSNLVLNFEPDEAGRFVMTNKAQVNLPATLPPQ